MNDRRPAARPRARDAAGDLDLRRLWRSPGPPAGPLSCSVCDASLESRFGWCSGCRLAFCFACGRGHFCRPSCQGNGCIGGLCVREVRDGTLSDRWGLPDE